MKTSFALVPVMMLAASAFADQGHHEAPAMPKEFDTLKQLVGTWEGVTKMHDQDTTTTVTYELTSGGTALTEKMMPGTEHEMLTVYHRDGKSLGMTHYCAMGNQPHMKLQKADDKSFAFEMKGHEGLASAKESHMHALKLTLNDADTLTQEWTNFENGKKGQVMTFVLKRKK